MVSLFVRSLSLASALSIGATVSALAVTPSVYVTEDGIAHFCFMEQSSGEVIVLDELCDHRSTSEGAKAPITPGDAATLIEFYNQQFCTLQTQEDLKGRSNATIITESNRENIQRSWAREVTYRKYDDIHQNASSSVFQQEIVPFTLKSLSECPSN